MLWRVKNKFHTNTTIICRNNEIPILSLVLYKNYIIHKNDDFSYLKDMYYVTYLTVYET